jgi:hypothetical protein
MLQLDRAEDSGAQLGRYHPNATVRAGYSADMYFFVAISICSFPGRIGMTRDHLLSTPTQPQHLHDVMTPSRSLG